MRPPHRSARAPRSRLLWVVAALVLLVVGYYGGSAALDASRRATEREQLFAELDRLLVAGDRNAERLSPLVARLRDLDPADRRVALLLARVDHLRGRHDAAAERLAGLVDSGGAAAELRLCAAVWLARQLTGGRDASERAEMLRQALRFADDAARDGDAPDDLFLAWTAALRLGDTAAVQERATALQQRHADSLQARTVARIDSSADLQQPLAPVESLVAEWAVAPVELRLMQAVLLLSTQAVDRAVAILDPLLAEAPNLLEVRNFAATAHHLAGLVQPAGAERDRHLSLRDEQIRWLDANADSSDARRPTWLSMQQQR